MANKTLFNSTGRHVHSRRRCDQRSRWTGVQLSPKAALAQYAATGCLNATFYASAEEQLQTILNLCSHPDVEPEFIARLALYARTRAT